MPEIKSRQIRAMGRIFRQILYSRNFKNALKTFLTNIDPDEAPRMIRDLIWDDPELAMELIRAMPSIMNYLVASLNEFGEGLGTRSPESLARLFNDAGKELDGKLLGETITRYAQLYNDIHKYYPELADETLAEYFDDVLTGIDFDEITQMVGSLAEMLVVLAGAWNQAIWLHPDRFASLVAMAPPFLNAGISSLKAMVDGLSEVAPGFTADVVFSLLEGLDAEEMGGLLESVAQVICKLHLESNLLVEGSTRMEEIIANKLRVILPSLDNEIVVKAYIAFREETEAISHAITATLADNPALVLELVSSLSTIINPRLSRLCGLVSTFKAVPADELADALATGLDGLEVEQVGEIVNSLVSLVNEIYERKPMPLSSYVERAVNTVDEEELKKAVRKVTADLASAIQLLADIRQ